MEIKPAYVTFEQAKKLKEKGFKERCRAIYCIGYANVKPDKELKFNYVFDECGEVIGTSTRIVPKGQPHLALAPEQWQVIEWLRIEHSYFISQTVSTIYQRYETIVYDIRGEKAIRKFLAVNYEYPQEAISAAIDYVLNNLL